jgi:hypothetical protein
VSHVLSESSESSGSRAEALPLHTRTLNVVVSRESAGLWRARGDVIDLRKTGCVPSVDDVQPAGIIHMMSIELDFDPATLHDWPEHETAFRAAAQRWTQSHAIA